jgi:hypothetical protein
MGSALSADTEASDTPDSVYREQFPRSSSQREPLKKPRSGDSRRHADMSVLISQACLGRHLSEMMDRICKGPEDVKKSVRAADELP